MRIFAPSGRPSKLRRMSDQFSKALAGGEDGKGVKNPETGTAAISIAFECSPKGQSIVKAVSSPLKVARGRIR